MSEQPGQAQQWHKLDDWQIIKTAKAWRERAEAAETLAGLAREMREKAGVAVDSWAEDLAMSACKWFIAHYDATGTTEPGGTTP